MLRNNFFRNLPCALTLVFAVLLSSSAVLAETDSGANPLGPEIKYQISMSKPFTHLLEVEMHVKWDNLDGQTEVKMPVWTPGSYLVREYSRHVMDFVAMDVDGNPLNWRKINKNTWQVDNGNSKEFRVGYNVYSNELTVRTNELNYEHAFITPPATLMYLEGQLKAPSTVKVNPWGNWKVATGLRPLGNNTFSAKNYDILYDSPIQVSDFKEKKFSVDGKMHRYAVTGRGNYNLDQMAIDTAKIAEESKKIFGDLPYDDYLLILNLRGGGGLEHLNSTALQWPRNAFAGPGYTRFLGLVAHEFFHLYNVKRMRPEPLGPFDYEKENYTHLLWVAEGTTSYYEWVILNRAGLINDKDVMRNYANIAENLQRQPGRFQTSLEEASFDAWIKFYRRDENAVNNQISYYSKGELVNFFLDIQIRAMSKNTKSLDDVMKYLYKKHFSNNTQFSSKDFQDACEMMAGGSLDDFFTKYVSGREELDYNKLLAPAGLRLNIRNASTNNGYFGARMRQVSGGVRVTAVPADTAAYAGGINYNDIIRQVDGQTFRSPGEIEAYARTKQAGDTIKVTVFRHGRNMDFNVVLKPTRPSGYEFVPVSSPTEMQKAIYKTHWLADLN